MGVVFDKNAARADVYDGQVRTTTFRAKLASDGGDSGSPVLWRGPGGEYYFVGLLWGGGSNLTDGEFIDISPWASIAAELGFTAVS